MGEQSNARDERGRAYTFSPGKLQQKKLAPEDPGSGVREAEMNVGWGKKSDTECQIWKLKSTGVLELSRMRRMSVKYIKHST